MVEFDVIVVDVYVFDFGLLVFEDSDGGLI